MHRKGKDYYTYDQEDGEVYYFFKIMDIKLQKQVWVSIEHLDLSKEAESIKCATLVLLGDRDANISLEEAKGLADTLSDARLKIIKNGSHALFFDYPKKMAEIITDFCLD